jgi:hypothetical protein
MDLLTMIVGLPFAPLRGVLSLAEVIMEQAEREFYDPARIRRAIDEVEAAAERGEISEEEKVEAQQQIIQPLLPQTQIGGASDSSHGA